MKRCSWLSLVRIPPVLALLGGAAACGSGTSPGVTVPGATTVPTSSPGTNVTLTAKLYDLGAGVNVLGLTSGSDGNIWFSECPDANGVGAVAKLTTSAQITVFALPDGSVACPKWLTLGNDRAVWFTEHALNTHVAFQSHMGRIDAAGNITEFGLPAGDSEPDGIIVGGDGNIWFDATSSNVAVVRGFSPITHSIAGSVALAPSVTLATSNNTLRVNPSDGAVIVASGSVTRVEPGPSPRPSQPLGIPAGRVCANTAPANDGFLYLQCNNAFLARASQATYYTAYIGEPKTVALSSGATPVTFSGPMAFGSDGSLYLWGTLGSPPAPTAFALSTAGIVEAYYIDPTASDQPLDVVLGADGAMWFTVSNGTRGIIVRVSPYQTIGN